MASLGEELPKEQARVRELILQYRALPQGVGIIGAMLMENSLREADKVIMEGDIVGMIRVYEDLKGYE